MSIQDILDNLKISKGAFYHYFDSKHSVLEALVDRMSKEAAQRLLPITQDSQLSALEKIRRYFEVSARWKNSYKALIMSLLRMWYSDENMRIRQRMIADSSNYLVQFLESVIRQG